MSTSSRILSRIREALQGLPALAATAPGRPPDPKAIFFPRDHARAIDPETALVVGNRGMGKSFWANALAHEESRAAIARAYQRELTGVDAKFVFASAYGPAGVSRSEIATLGGDVPSEHIWRAALLPYLALQLTPSITPPEPLRERVRWVQEHPAHYRELLLSADHWLEKHGRRVVFLFDALDQLAEDWPTIQRLTKGILKLALGMHSYKHIRIKIFMRPDQFENRELFHFPDGSKIKTGGVRLSWRSIELYGLLFFLLSRAATDAFLDLCKTADIAAERKDPLLGLPDELLNREPSQKTLFQKIAGPFMGKNEKRGFPYTWVPVHLADARREVAPRTFLLALRQAAHHSPAPTETAIDYHGIFDGVRSASEQRLLELEEDYPWVSSALEPLRGVQVPAEARIIFEKWKQVGVIETISRHHRTKGPIGLDLTTVTSSDDAGLSVLQSNLEAIGVMEVRANGKIDIPDIFRVKAGILRKGGVTPQQRKRL